jgi:hypothetical protein
VDAAGSELDRILAEAHLEIKSAEGELAEVAAAHSRRESPDDAPQVDPARLAEFERMEAEFGVSMEPHAGADHPGHTANEIIRTVEKVAEELHERRRHRSHAAEPQWFYARENQSHGPVSQSELVKLFEKGELPLTTLVWQRPMKEWKSASETELADLAEVGTPPPLPGAAPLVATPPVFKEPVCGKCGQIGKLGDRFCSACGRPLPS